MFYISLPQVQYISKYVGPIRGSMTASVFLTQKKCFCDLRIEDNLYEPDIRLLRLFFFKFFSLLASNRQVP